MTTWIIGYVIAFVLFGGYAVCLCKMAARGDE